MSQIDIKCDYKSRVLAIWEKYKNIPVLDEPGCEYRKSPILPEVVKADCILFVGINPSFSKKENERELDEIEFYRESVNEEKDIQYFEKFKDIAQYCHKDWTHLDLFFMRETNQKVIEELSNKDIAFLQAQLDVTFEIIERACPRVIVVSNSFASEFFGKKKNKHSAFEKIWMGFDLDFEKDFDLELGTYKIKLGSKFVPIFFSGMLSGQRALDIGSLERLKWQIKRVLDITKK